MRAHWNSPSGVNGLARHPVHPSAAALWKAHDALATGDLEAFEGYRESASILLQTSQSQYPWIYAGYLALGVVLVAVRSRHITKVRAP